MKPITMMMLALVLAGYGAVAGEIYGTITEGGKPVAAGIKVKVGTSGKADSVETDKFGTYRIFVKEKGKCVLTVHTKDQSPSVELVSYDKPRRYDWVLESKEGKLSLRRK